MDPRLGLELGTEMKLNPASRLELIASFMLAGSVDSSSPVILWKLRKSETYYISVNRQKKTRPNHHNAPAGGE